MNLRYKQAPLPFQGQKRFFISRFAEEIVNMPKNTIFVDLFGGSGLLSRTAKDVNPKCRVIYNDYDIYCARIKAIPTTNRILAELRPILVNVKDKTRVPDKERAKVISVLEKYDKETFVDYITLSGALLFSPKYRTDLAGFRQETFYNRVRLSDYLPADDYLDGLEIRHCDYKEVYQEFVGNKNVVFILDPPYLNTDTASYSSFWKLRDYLDVLKCLNDVRYAYFTSEKSSLIELLECLEQNYGILNPFAQAKKIERKNVCNKGSSYKDIMLISV